MTALIKGGTETHDISRTSLGTTRQRLRLLLASRSGLDETRHRGEHTAHVPARIRRYSGHEALAGFGGEVWFFDLALGRVLWVNWY